jgi:metallo-beta-lactamase family protein
LHDTLAEKGRQRIVFSGDLGSKQETLLRPTELIGRADIVIMESTYGDKDHSIEDPKRIIHDEINAIEQNGGTLLIPAFSIEKTQEILHIIDHLKKDKKVQDKTQIFLDSPMAIKATQTYKQFSFLYSDELRDHCKHDDPFDFPGLSMIVSANRSKLIRQVAAPKTIIAGSGMMSGGRILYHAQQYLKDPTTRLLFVGYQAEGTIGRQILEGAKTVNIYGQNIPIHSHIRRTQAMSSHAGQTQLLKWLSTMKGIDKIFITHGEETPRQTLADKITNELDHHDITLPQLGDEVEIN